ncbi:MAG: DegT/DnrJ/EryC1/StrS family aminotransferase [Melioribacteraceae bacterium]|nr:DegT/DnrJ/EryC1/StrS family aminotransferase [Melioribacteraceae bacterium]
MIPVFKPLIEKEEIDAAVGALEMGWLGMGKFVNEFENKIKQIIGADDREVIAVGTGTAAIHLALLIAGIGPGDEVITPSFNNVCDFQSILTTGAEVVFCDIDENSLCIDLESAEKLITSKTKAIIAMDYDCVLCEHDKLGELAKKYNLRVIHDASHSFGSKYKGKMVGSFSDITTFSFDPVKTITCIDGGAIVVKSEEEKKILHEMRLVGMMQPADIMYENKRAWTYDVQRVGYRYHMANLHAAIGLSQLEKFDEISRNRFNLCNYYSKKLKNIPEIIIPKTDFQGITPFLYYIRVPAESRDELRNYLYSNGIDTGIHWQPGHWFSLLKNCRKSDLSITNKIGEEILSLPLHSDMSLETVDIIINAIKFFFNKR